MFMPTREGLFILKARKQARLERKAQRKKSGPDHAKFDEQTHKLHVLRQKNPGAVICGMCGVFFPSIEGLRLHLADAHKLNSGERSTRTPRQTLRTSTSRPRGIDNSTSGRKCFVLEADNPFAQEARERKMDATYGMGGTARDHGQFGSASSYDGMDDESTP
jgi:hypothetical protein